MEANRNKTQVVLLPTENKSHIVKIGDDLIYVNIPERYYHKRSDGSNYRDSIFQHLHFIETKEVKLGDPMIEDAWYINTYRGFGKPFKNINLSNNGYLQRIIASTDPEITEFLQPCMVAPHGADMPIAQPSSSFQQKYCKMGGIDFVNVEYEDDNEGTSIIKEEWILKVDNHNTITIHPIKESYTPEELEECAMNAVYKMMFRANEFPDDYKVKAKSFITDWINTNA